MGCVCTVLDMTKTIQSELALLTPAEVSNLLRIPIKTLYAWRSRNLGPRALRLGKHLRYRTDDVQSWLDSEEMER